MASIGTKQRLFAHPQRQGRPQTQSKGPLNSASSGALTTEEQIFESAGQKYGVPASVLWGIYGVETAFGHNVARSSAGAVGPMQFEPGTAAMYHINPNDLRQAVMGAAHYISDLTKRYGSITEAIKAYNGGTPQKAAPDYLPKVQAAAKTWKGPGGGTPIPGGVSLTSGVPGAVSGVISGAADVGQLIGMILDPTQFAKLLVDTTALMGRWIVQATYKWVFLPPWHATQRAVDYYWTVDMGNGSKALITIAWWATGYMVLHVDMETGSLNPIGKPVAKPSKTPLGRLLNHGKALAKSGAIVKPKRVESETASKPKTVESTVGLDRMRTLSARRNRAVTVTESAQNGDRGREGEPRPGRGIRPEAPLPSPNGNASTGAKAKPKTAPGGKSGVDTQSGGRRNSTRNAGAVPGGNGSGV